MNSVITFIFALIGLHMHLIFLERRHWFTQRNLFPILLGESVILFVVSHILTTNNIGDKDVIALLRYPLYTFGIFHLLRFVFVRFVRREPMDTFWTTEKNLARDKVFNIVFWVTGLIVPAILIYDVGI